MDSLPSLIERACNTEDKVCDGVISYLLLLSAKELYQEDEFKSLPNVKSLLGDVERHITDIKMSNRIQLEQASANDRKKFFDWLEKQFSQQYITIAREQQ